MLEVTLTLFSIVTLSMQIAHLRDVSIHYQRCGTGIPTLVLHGGLGSDHTYLRPWLDGLGGSLELIYYDQRCNGRSLGPALETLTLESLANDADQLRNHLGFDRVAVLGHSFGGLVAAQIAILFPEIVSHLVLVDGCVVFGEEEIGAMMTLAHERAPLLAAKFQEPFRTDEEMGAYMNEMAPLYFWQTEPALRREVYKDTIWRADAAKRGEEILLAADLRPTLDQIRCPTLVAVGRHDFGCSPKHAQMIHQGIVGSELVVFEDSGHLPQVEEHERFTSVVTDWFRRSKRIDFGRQSQ